MTPDPPCPVTVDHPPVHLAPAGAITPYLKVADRALALGWPVLEGFSVLPDNFESAADIGELRLPSEASTIRTLLRNEGLPIGPLKPSGAQVPYVSNNSFGWLGPTLFISAGLISNQPHAVSIALGVLTNYLSDLLKGQRRPKTVKLEFVVERRGDRLCRKLTYEGPVEGLVALADPIRKLADE